VGSEYLKIKGAATLLGVSESTLRNWERAGKITAYRHPVNGYRLFKQSDIDSLLRRVEQSVVVRNSGRNSDEED
jgi:MerR family transcriptional regulator, copper efflux regulator